MIYVSKKDLNNNLITLQLNLFDMKKILVPTDFSSNAEARQRKCVTIHQYHCWQYLQ